MRLCPEEERMLSGKNGPGIQRAMQLLVAVGDAYDAPGMIDISFAHIIPTDMLQYPMGQFGAWTRELVAESVEGADRFKVSTTLNPTFLDLRLGRRLGYPQACSDEIKASLQHGARTYKRLGGIPAYTCSPDLMFPSRKGQHVGTAESSVVLFYNSVFGAMVNRESGPTALAAALTGKVPLYGMHLAQNRYGRVLVELKDDLKPGHFSKTDYAVLSYYVGGLAVDKIPVFSGLPPGMSLTELKYLSASLAVSAGLPMMHVIGITPEAPTHKAAFGGRKPEFRIEVGIREMHDTFEDLRSAIDNKLELVLLGCPHVSITEIQDIAARLKGRRLHTNVNLVVGTLEPVRTMAKKMGLVDVIEKAGGLVVSGMCTACPFLRRQVPKNFQIGTVATDSAKAAHNLKNAGVKVWLGNTQACIIAALEGKLEIY